MSLLYISLLQRKIFTHGKKPTYKVFYNVKLSSSWTLHCIYRHKCKLCVKFKMQTDIQKKIIQRWQQDRESSLLKWSYKPLDSSSPLFNLLLFSSVQLMCWMSTNQTLIISMSIPWPNSIHLCISPIHYFAKNKFWFSSFELRGWVSFMTTG